MLRVAMIQRFLPSRSRGGVGHFTDGLADALERHGHRVTVLSQDPAPEGARYTVRAIPPTRPVVGLRSSPLTFPFQVARADLTGFDLVHAQGDDHLLPRRLPVIRTMHGSALAEAVHNGWRRRAPRRFLLHLWFYAAELLADLRAHRVVAVSRDTARYYPRVHAVIPNGVDVARFARHRGPRSSAPSILFVGDLDSRKRGRWLLDVVARAVRPSIPAVELWLVCPERVEALGVRWFGAVDAEGLARLYGAAWVFCLPSSYEGFGRPYVEALAAGTPVVATPNPGAREILADGQYGLMVSDGVLGETLRALLTRPELRAGFTERGMARAMVYDWERVAKQYERIYEAALGRGPGWSPTA